MKVDLPEAVLRHMLSEYQQDRLSGSTKDEYKKILEKAGLIKPEPKVYKTYTVTVNFAGFIGYDNDYEVDAESEEDAIIKAEEMARDDLEVDDVDEVDTDEWRVGICYANMSGGVEQYTEYADSEEDAVEQALADAAADLSGEITDVEDWGE